jgi:hypothetical protein
MTTDVAAVTNGGAPEYMYDDRTAWRCAFFVGKKYGSKGYPQRNAHMGKYHLAPMVAHSRNSCTCNQTLKGKQ